MNQWINALKAPFVDTASVPESDRPSNGQVAVVWCLVGVLISRTL